ncbi:MULTISPECIES: hypothetical protein [unclassified Chryseobacterium]|uniref:hypothetical protein n=1 Tax=unclassified Chryseobacterium TaxID=2593645 RepID=UPI0028533C56|nr:hypothetical protein [Chryseobacterium sp. CFS7]MDR4891595.1 hypothetical protein [Chryseobacterium sp. CFS7]
MKPEFFQKTVQLNPEKSTGKLRVSKLCELIDSHPYRDEIYSSFKISEIQDEIICIDYIDLVYERVKYYNENYNRSFIYAQVKDIDVYDDEQIIDGEINTDIIFNFEEYVEIDEVKNNLRTIAIYDAKNTFLDSYEMTKYANNLFKIREGALARQNIQYFKEKAKTNSKVNKHKSYRLVEYNSQFYLRGITSINKYFEYGVDFTFVVSMLILHQNMKYKVGVEYTIRSAALNESKLDIIVSEKFLKDAGAFGSISTAVKISTNDLGQGSLSFSNILSVGRIEKGFFIYRRKSEVEKNKEIIPHTTKPENVFSTFNNMEGVLNTSDEFIQELNEIKSIKTPDELRVKILAKIKNPRSALKGITKLSDIFKWKIDNEISSFAKLIEMCENAEDLEIEYDLKDKLRYIISDIMLYGG